MARPDLIALEYAAVTDAQQVGYWSPTGDELAIIYRQSPPTPSPTPSTTLPRTLVLGRRGALGHRQHSIRTPVGVDS